MICELELFFVVVLELRYMYRLIRQPSSVKIRMRKHENQKTTFIEMALNDEQVRKFQEGLELLQSIISHSPPPPISLPGPSGLQRRG